MNKLAILAIGLLVAGTATVASAGDTAFDRKRAQQLSDIEHGRRTGALTWREGLQLRREQRRLEILRSQLEADGHLSRQDRETLKDAQSDAGAHIHYESSDARRRKSWLPRFGK